MCALWEHLPICCTCPPGIDATAFDSCTSQPQTDAAQQPCAQGNLAMCWPGANGHQHTNLCQTPWQTHTAQWPHEHARPCAHTSTHMRAQAHTHTCTHWRAHMCTHAERRTHTCIHTHNQKAVALCTHACAHTPCDGHTLLLASTELQSSLPHECVIPIRHGHDGVVDVSCASHSLHLGAKRGRGKGMGADSGRNKGLGTKKGHV